MTSLRSSLAGIAMTTPVSISTRPSMMNVREESHAICPSSSMTETPSAESVTYSIQT